MSNTLIAIIVPVFIAFIAGMVALYQVKSNVISAARIKWMENLREILCLYCSELETCSVAKLDLEDISKDKTGKDLDDVLDKFYYPYSNSAKELLKLQSKAFLYLDSKKPEHKKIEELIRKNSLLVHDRNINGRKEIQKNLEEIIIISKTIFEVEWKRSRKLFKI